MLQPSIIPSPVSMELGESLQQTLLQQTLTRPRLHTLRALGLTVTLPNNLQGFLLFLLGLSLVAVGLIMQILLSIQIWQTTAKLDVLKAEYQKIEQQNTTLVWDIAQQSTLEHIQQRAQNLGYKVNLDRYYVVAPPTAQQVVVPHSPALSASSYASQNTSLNTAKEAANSLPEASFAAHLQTAAQAFHAWWQRQWHKLLQIS